MVTVIGNWVAHLGQIVSGEENVSIGKCLMPLHVLAMVWTWGLYGLALAFAHHAVIGTYYFTLALMNHNSERSMDVKGRNAAKVRIFIFFRVPRPVQFHPDGGQFDFVWLSAARTPHGGASYVLWAQRN